MASKERLFLNDEKTVAVIVEQNDNGNLDVSFCTRETYADIWPVPTKLEEPLTAHDILRMT